MHNTTLSPRTEERPAKADQINACLLHATACEASPRPGSVDDATLSKLLRRRLSRLERVIDAHGGLLVRHLPQGLLVAFDTAEAAVLIAAEMQRRCAVIPQIQETRIALKIGIHAATPGLEAAAEAAACGLATAHEGDAIVASGVAIEALPDILRQKTSVLAGDNSGLAAHLVDWKTFPAPPVRVTAPAPRNPAPRDSDKPRRICLVLRQGERSYRFSGEKSSIAIGRDPANDIPIQSPKASRQHCRIIYRDDSLELVDLSMNGTYVKSGDGPELAIRKTRTPLTGKGKIGFGHSCLGDAGQAFDYEIY